MSCSSSSKAKRGGGGRLQGPRPQPLSLPTMSPPRRSSKRPRVSGGGGGDDVGGPGPVIVYEHTPKVIHVRPDEFMAVVQRLTGCQQQRLHPTQATATPPEEATEVADPLVLTLGQQAPPLDHYSAVPASPGGRAAAGFLLSPGSFLFSPATMRAIQELIS